MPLPLYLMTHAYFCFYHALANVVLRRARAAAAGRGRGAAACATAAAVFLLAYATAVMETATIAHFPYYTFKARLALGRNENAGCTSPTAASGRGPRSAEQYVLSAGVRFACGGKLGPSRAE